MSNDENVKKESSILSKENFTFFDERKPIYVVSAPMGAGKTTAFINNIESDKNYVFAVPKIDLAEEVSERINKDTDHTCQMIHSRDGVYGNVKDKIERALNEDRTGSVIVITHASLLNIESQYLEGWVVVIDEVPDVNNCKSKRIGYLNYKDLFEEWVTIDENLNCSFDPSFVGDIRPRYEEAKRTGQEEITLMYGGLFDEHAEIQLEENDGTWIIKHHGYKDFSKIIDCADEFHVMGNGVEKTLFYLYLQSKQYEFKTSRYQPAFKGYDIPPVFVPMISGKKFSKEMMLTKEDGNKAKAFDNTCFGWKILEEALEYHEGEDVIVQVFKWMKTFPFEDYPNVTVTDFDVRGLNEYRDYHRTVNLVHGNPDPIQSRMQERMLEMMGVDVEKGRAAIRHERHIEPMAQHILRTNMREIGKQKQATITVLPTVDVAEKLEEILMVDGVIDTSIMREPPKSKAKVSKEEKKRKAFDLFTSGMKKKDIATELDISRPTLNNWLKEAA